MRKDDNNKPVYQDKPLYPKLLWQRPVHYYKAAAGKVLVLAGSKGTTGTAILTCETVFRSGTGILILGFPESLRSFYKDILPEAMTLELPETPSHSLSRKAKDPILDIAHSCDSVVIGPGISQNAETIQLIWELIFEIEKPVILDADGLTALIEGIEVMLSKENENFLIDYFKHKKSQLVLTLRPGEAANIAKALRIDAKFTLSYINKHREEISLAIAKMLSSTVVLKGQNTLVATDEGELIINRLGGSRTATEVTGDVLSSVIGSFVGQNPENRLEAIATAIYLHEIAADIARQKIGDRNILASDIVRYLPQAIKEAENE